MAAVVDPAAAWGQHPVVQALVDLKAYHATVLSGRWSRATAITAVGGLFELIGPLRDPLSAFAPPAFAAEAVALQAAHFVSVNPAVPSGLSFPASWDLFPVGAWAPLKQRATQDWRLVGRILSALHLFALSQVPAVVADPLVLLQRQMAEQQAQNLQMITALQAQLAAQQARIDAAAAAAVVVPRPPVVSPELQSVVDEFRASPVMAGSAEFGAPWSLSKAETVVAVLLVHARKLAALVLASGSDIFGLDPLSGIRPAAIPLLVHLCPELSAEDPDCLAGIRNTLELVCAFAFCLQKIALKWQEFVVMIEPTFVPSDLLSLVPSGTTVPVVSPAVLATPPVAAAPLSPVAPLTPPAVFKQADADVVAAVRGEQISPDALCLSGGPLLTRLTPVRPTSGLHKGLNLRVSPRQSFAEDESPSWEIGIDGRSHLKINSKCKTLEEWEQGFLQIVLAAPSKEGGQILLHFHSWFRLRALQFGFKTLLEFYDFLLRLIGEDRASMEESRVQIAWQEFQLRKFQSGIDLYTPGTPKVASPERPPKAQRLLDVAPKPPTVPKFKGKYCFNFNMAKGCVKGQDCTHPHVCKKCGGPHPAQKCGKA